MTLSTKIKLAEAYANLTEAEVARRFGTSVQNFHQRMKTAKFTSEELDKIAEALGAKYVCYFEFPDGTKL